MNKDRSHPVYDALVTEHINLSFKSHQFLNSIYFAMCFSLYNTVSICHRHLKYINKIFGLKKCIQISTISISLIELKRLKLPFIALCSSQWISAPHSKSSFSSEWCTNLQQSGFISCLRSGELRVSFRPLLSSCFLPCFISLTMFLHI